MIPIALLGKSARPYGQSAVQLMLLFGGLCCPVAQLVDQCAVRGDPY
jgi:hypothetical protein